MCEATARLRTGLLHERVSASKSELGKVPHGHGLPVAPTHPAAHRVSDAHDGVPNLVDASCVLGRRAVTDPFAVDVKLAPPFAVVVTVKAEIETRAQMEARIGNGLDLDRAHSAVGHRAV